MATEITIGTVSLTHFSLAIIIMIFTTFLGNIAYTVIKNLIEKRASKRISKTIAKIVQYVVITAGFYYAIYNILGLDLTALAASIGVLSVVVAFSAQQIVQNALAGILIALQRPLRLEDWIEIGFPSTGINRVKDMTLTTTILEDLDGRIIYIPNSMILTSKLINYSQNSFSTIQFKIEIPNKANIEKVKTIITKIMGNHKLILPEVSKREKSRIKKLLNITTSFKTQTKDLTPEILISQIDKDSTTLNVRCWIRKVQDSSKITSEVLNSIKEKFKEEKIWN